MARLGDLRDPPPLLASTLDLDNLVDSGIHFADDIQRRLYIHRHPKFLRDCGYLHPPQHEDGRNGSLAKAKELGPRPVARSRQ